MGNLDAPPANKTLVARAGRKEKQPKQPRTSASGSNAGRGPIEVPEFSDVCSRAPEEIVEIKETISELAYLTHNYYRYYGKFPSKLAAILIQRFGRPGQLVFDNYVGSGTTLVEAKLAGLDSIGIDINPAGVLAGNVKTHNYNEQELDQRWHSLRREITAAISHVRGGPSQPQSLYSSDARDVKAQHPHVPDLAKWFSEKAVQELATMKSVLQTLAADPCKEFFVVAFLAIIRRVSNAYDGEVRPHINPEKKPRPVLEAYVKKVEEMIRRKKEFNAAANNPATSRCYLWDARQLDSLPALQDRGPGLVISHPPYLNCFNYIPTFKLDLIWAQGFDDLPSFTPGWTHDEIRNSEIMSWPATNQELLVDYFQFNRNVYKKVFDVLTPGGRCCIVIGDATVYKRLIRTHKIFARMCEDIGFQLERIIYRTTHYGTGKYAYNHRADYHSEEEGKKDATLILRKPS
jgi:DNA modification methylase